MNYEQIAGVLRAVLPALLAYAVGKGWVSSSSVADITAGIIAVGAALWSIFAHTTTQQVANVNAMPAVAGVITAKTPEGVALAQAIPSATVAPAGSPTAGSIASAP